MMQAIPFGPIWLWGRSRDWEPPDWGEIDLDRGYVTVANKAKTQRRRLVPIEENLKRWRNALRKESYQERGLLLC